jgi:hypothetical protein
MPAPLAPAPHRLYYLHNFQHALHWLVQRYADLLDAPAQEFLQHWEGFPAPSQALLVRMVMRRGPWFRQSKLQYEEIGDTLQAAAPLQALGWIDAQAPMPLEALFDLHTRPELQSMLGKPPAHASRKADWLAHVALTARASQTYAQWHPQSTECAWLLSEHIRTLCTRLRLMFFGNLRQDWSEFVLADLGIFRYESVPLDASARAFRSQADIDTYLAMQQCRDALYDRDDIGSEDIANALQQLHACRSPNPWLERRRAKLLMQLGQVCEKAQDWAQAQTVYAQCHYPGARQRHIRMLERQGAYAQAMTLAQVALQAPESEEEQQKLQRMLPRLQRHALITNKLRRTRAETAAVERLDVRLVPSTDNPRVEYALRAHWDTPDAPVFYVENTLMTALFGLLCWPAVFAPLQGAFFHPFQSAPADFAAPDFYARRAPLFAQCLAQLDDRSYRATIRQRFIDKHGLQNPLVIWPALNAQVLELALECIPAAHLRCLFERLQADPKNHRTGWPDLIRFWPAQQRYAMVEVKAPGDKLQDNQVRWLAYFAQHGIPAQVCHVTWEQPAMEPACA